VSLSYVVAITRPHHWSCQCPWCPTRAPKVLNLTPARTKHKTVRNQSIKMNLYSISYTILNGSTEQLKAPGLNSTYKKSIIKPRKLCALKNNSSTQTDNCELSISYLFTFQTENMHNVKHADRRLLNTRETPGKTVKITWLVQLHI